MKISAPLILAAALLSTACGTSSDAAPASAPAGAADSVDAERDPPIIDAPSVAAAADVHALPPVATAGRAPAPLRGIYLNAYAAGSTNRLGTLLALADSTEINAFVIDVKDERGIRYRSENELAMQLAQPGEVTIRDLAALATRLKERGVWSIARIVLFKDPLLSAARPSGRSASRMARRGWIARAIRG
jgi:hypothetical protein